nr:unnamed protein product [Digitaria exilis]
MAFCCVPEKEDHRERAVKEVAEVYERIKIQQPLLLLHCSSSHQHQHHLAQTLLGEALRALNVALSVMTTTSSPAAAPATSVVVVKAEPHHEPSPPSPAGRSGSNKKRRRSITAMEAASSSWAGLTTVPYDDGYEWRKYGEKKINGTNYTRSYFRCTYKDDTGCLATKYVQQKDSSDPPVFRVTYNNKHTCNNAAAAAMVNNTIKQEPQPVVLLPPLIEASALPFDDQTLPCKQQAPPVFPITMPQQLFSARDCHGGGDIPSTSSSSSFSGGGESCSCDEFYSPGRGIHMDNMVQRQMPAASAAPADDDLSFYDYDLDLFLLCDSFKDY